MQPRRALRAAAACAAFAMKRILQICRSLFDRVAALLLLIMLAPSLALVAFLLRTNTNEPILVTDDLVAEARRFAPTAFVPLGEGPLHFGPLAISSVYIPLQNFRGCGVL